MMIKNVIWSVVTVCIILLINWGIAFFLNAEFIEYSFLTGIGIVALVKFFNSSGGIGSNSVRLETQAQTGIKINEKKKEFNPSAVFFTAVTYTIIALIITVFYYKDYFID